jgi:hypothetical protein
MERRRSRRPEPNRPFTDPNGDAAVFGVGADGDLLEVARDTTTGDWGTTDITAVGTGAPKNLLCATPTVDPEGNLMSVFGLSGNDLVQFTRSANAGVWGTTDITSIGANVPANLPCEQPYVDPNGDLSVFALSGGDVDQIARDVQTAKWTTTDITQVNTGIPQFSHCPIPILDPSGDLSVLGVDAGGDLVEVARNPSTYVWFLADITSLGSGVPKSLQCATPFVDPDGSLSVFGVSDGDLLDVARNPSTYRWVSTDITSTGADVPQFTNSCPTPFTDPDGEMSVFGLTPAGDLVEVSRDKTTGTWSSQDITANVTPTPTSPGSSGTVTTPPATRKRAVRAQLRFRWKYAGDRTRVLSIKARGLPHDGRVTVRCRGHHCPRPSARSASTARVGRLWKAITKQALTAGDRETFTITAPGLAAERIELVIRDHRRPLAKLL